jgi:streptogramin lyase
VLVRLDARTGERLGTPIPLPGEVNGLLAERDSVWIVVVTADPGTDELLRFDAATGAERDRLAVPEGVRRVAHTRGEAWLLTTHPARLVRIDLAGHRHHELRFEADASGDMAVGHGSMWVTLTDVDQLARVGLRTLDVATVAVGRSPVGVAVQGGSVWVANRESSTLSRVDAGSDRVRGEIEVPLNPYELAVRGNALWVTSLAEGKLTRITARAG